MRPADAEEAEQLGNRNHPEAGMMDADHSSVDPAFYRPSDSPSRSGGRGGGEEEVLLDRLRIASVAGSRP